MKEKSERNRTIDISIEDGARYLDWCVKVEGPVEMDKVLDKTIIGDTFKVLRNLPVNSVDLLIADPPYNMRKAFAGGVFSKKKAEEYEKYTREWLSLVYPLLKDTGSIYVCCDWETSLIIGKVMSELFAVKNRITWQREKGRGAASNWKSSHEDIWFATKSDRYTFNLDAVKVRKKVIAPYKVEGQPKDWQETEKGNFRDTCPSNFWDDVTVPFWSMPENTAHPTQKPEKLAAKMILASSNEGDIVLDPFLGSGTTSVVAKKLRRHYVGIEMSGQYCVWAERRLEMAEEDPSIQGYSGGVFWERNSYAMQEKKK